MLKLKDLILENPADYVDKDVDKMDMLYRKKKYNFYEADDHEGKMAKQQLERLSNRWIDTRQFSTSDKNSSSSFCKSFAIIIASTAYCPALRLRFMIGGAAVVS